MTPLTALRDPIAFLWHTGECPRCEEKLKTVPGGDSKYCPDALCKFVHIDRVEEDGKVTFKLVYTKEKGE